MTMARRGARRGAVVVAVLAAGAVGAGCADDEPSGAATAPTAGSSVSASALPGATESGFVLLDTRPPGMDSVAGTAWLATGDDPGTTLTVSLTGLEPGTEYIGHLHAQACGEGNGGPHFQFDQAGSDQPPNEVHIGFTAEANGAGTATITNPQPVGDGARSVVVHPADASDNRLVCADF